MFISKFVFCMVEISYDFIGNEEDVVFIIDVVDSWLIIVWRDDCVFIGFNYWFFNNCCNCFGVFIFNCFFNCCCSSYFVIFICI